MRSLHWSYFVYILKFCELFHKEDTKMAFSKTVYLMLSNWNESAVIKSWSRCFYFQNGSSNLQERAWQILGSSCSSHTQLVCCWYVWRTFCFFTDNYETFSVILVMSMSTDLLWCQSALLSDLYLEFYVFFNCWKCTKVHHFIVFSVLIFIINFVSC